VPALPTSLQSLLDAGGKAAVERMLRERPELLEQRLSSTRDLAVAASFGEGLSMAFLRLHAFEHFVVSALVAAPEPVTLVDVAALLGVDEDAVRPVLEHFEILGLAALRGTTVWVLPQVRSLPLPHHGPRAARMLAAVTVDQLKHMAKRLGIREVGLKKADLTAVIVEALSSRQVVKDVVVRGPRGTVELMQELLEQPRLEVAWSSSSMTQPATPLGWLREHGLLLDDPQEWGLAVVPLEVGLALGDGRLSSAPLRTTPPVLLGQPVDDPRAAEQCASAALQVVAQVRAVCEALGAQPAPLLASGGVGVREVRRVAKQLRLPDRVVARRLELAAATGLVAVSRTVGSVAPTAQYDEWAELPLVARWVALVRAWRAMRHHPSAALRVGDNGKTAPALDSPPSRRATEQRASILTALATTDGRVMPEPVRERVRFDRPTAWFDADPSLLLELLEETDELGLTSIGWLGPLGRALVANGVDAAATLLSAHAPAAAETFVISGDLTALVSGELAPAVAAELALLADLESDGTAQLYRFTETSVRRGLDAGRSVEDVLAYLATHAARGVPQPLDYLVRDLGRRHGRVRVGALGSFCRSDDETLLKEMLHDRRLVALRLRELVPGMLGSDASPAELVDRLRATGYLPVHEGPDGAVVPTRPVATRSPAAPRWAPPGDTPVIDVSAVAERIVAGSPTTRQSLASVPDGEWCEECQRVHPVGNEVDRPVDTEHDPLRIAELLDNAEFFDWSLELSYAGRTVQGWVNNLDLDRGRLDFDSTDGVDRKITLPSITSARVLSEAEELRLL
jgi:Helicase conserved C-terminal domain